LAKLTSTVMVFTEIMLHDHRREDFTRFEANLRDFDEITECHLVSGGYDYLLKSVVKNIGHYQEVIETLIDRNIGIEKYFSYIVIRSPFHQTNGTARQAVVGRLIWRVRNDDEGTVHLHV